MHDAGDDQTEPGRFLSLETLTMPPFKDLRRAEDGPIKQLAEHVETAVTHVEARITEYTERVAAHERAEDSQLTRLESIITRLVEGQSKFQGDTERAISAQWQMATDLEKYRKLQQEQLDTSKAEIVVLKELVALIRTELRGLRKDLADQHLRTAAKFAQGSENGHP